MVHQSVFTQDMLGPVIDIELVDPPDRNPPGVVYGIKHFLEKDLEGSQEEANSHNHYIIKMTKKHCQRHNGPRN